MALKKISCKEPFFPGGISSKRQGENSSQVFVQHIYS